MKMKVIFSRNDGSGLKKVKEFEAKREFKIDLPNIGKIKVKKLMPFVNILDDYYVIMKYSVKIGDKVYIGGKYEILKVLLEKKVKNLPETVVDTLYYGVPSVITTIIEVYKGDELIASINYYMDKRDKLRLVVKFMGSHFVKDVWAYDIFKDDKLTLKTEQEGIA